MYQLLGNGTVPFRGSEAEYLMSVSRGPEFSGAAWDGVSDAARQLVTALLSHTAGERPGAGAVLRCGWAGGGAGGRNLPVLSRPPSAAALAVQLAQSGQFPSSDATVRWKGGEL